MRVPAMDDGGHVVLGAVCADAGPEVENGGGVFRHVAIWPALELEVRHQSSLPAFLLKSKGENERM